MMSVVSRNSIDMRQFPPERPSGAGRNNTSPSARGNLRIMSTGTSVFHPAKKLTLTVM
jgi:hypothetical protein